MHNYQLNAVTVLRDLYRLITIVFAEEALMSAAKEEGDPLRSLRHRFIDDELVHLLIGTAIANRIQLEHMHEQRLIEIKPGFKPSDYSCGQLQPDSNVYAHIPLSFSEACNKIIHAPKILAQFSEVMYPSPIKPELTLRGQKNNKTWIAHLDLIEYVRVSTRNFDYLV